MAVTMRQAGSLQHAMSHHAKELEPIVGVLALGILTELIPRGWDLEQVLAGAQSFVLRKGGMEYHFRAAGRPYRAIAVKDAWRQGAEVCVIRSRVDALRFVRDRVAES